MLELKVPSAEFYDEEKEEFFRTKPTTLKLEHSLVSISKWESKWKKPFISKDEKTTEEILDYIRCMTITQNVDPMVYLAITEQNFKEVDAYIGDPMTATWFKEGLGGKGPSREVITSEIIYYWMTALNIPPEYQKWHINRLLTLINVCNIKNQPPKKMSHAEARSRNEALNAARRKQYHSRG